MKERGVTRLITTTPEIDGGSFGTNVMEGVLVALSGRKPDQLTAADYMGLLEKLNWQPRIQTLTEVSRPMPQMHLTSLIHQEDDWFVALCPELDIASQGEI